MYNISWLLITPDLKVGAIDFQIITIKNVTHIVVT